MYSEIMRAGKLLYPVESFKDLYKRLSFICSAIKHKDLLIAFSSKIHTLGYGNLFNLTPHVIGVVQWPYIHNNWCLSKRIQTIIHHYEILKETSNTLNVTFGNTTEFVNLTAYSHLARLVLDKPCWFAREGEVTLNLYKEDLRVMSIAFTMGEEDGERVLFVGCIQGIHSQIPRDIAQEMIKTLTKEFFGLRPRSLIIEALKLIASQYHFKKILAISDANRHHRHAFFKGHLNKSPTSNYDEIWTDNGGTRLQNGFFEISVKQNRNALEEVPSNKRAMYRRRYAMLDDIQSQLTIHLMQNGETSCHVMP